MSICAGKRDDMTKSGHQFRHWLAKSRADDETRVLVSSLLQIRAAQ
ncbi:hypothetical protein BN931_1442 [Bifidobacterium animalis subsp. lactis CECT 8145]|nr:hypothetical protein M8PIadj_0173 [Bifidobacterium animalis]CDL72212.1 hypothetical protein BN931_1442 [Bifidobacterium animalis subsp. lactis CECT 8145]